ncbi:MAG: helix-turn-helix transcriptional regulator [Planctomycetes bacterium]|nr:helix-turn-helix transcriptional regulator [Planctomycetota bacterium]
MRKKRGITQGQLAKECGVHLSFISAVERGESAPGRDVLFRIATTLSVSPQFIESGELGDDDRARIARFELWPELVYLVANQFIVPRRLPLAKVIPDQPQIQEAVRVAWQSRHFCEYWSWATSRDGRKVADGLAGHGAIESLIDGAIQSGISQSGNTGWIELANRTLAAPTTEKNTHSSAVGYHIPYQPSRCFEFDIETCANLRNAIPAFLHRAGKYASNILSRSFIEKAFPSFFWSASRLWGDRRMAGWIWYLNMPFDLFGPLARLARSYDDVEKFKAAGSRLLDQSTIEDRDVFLGLFDDVIAEPGRYNAEFGEHPLNCGNIMGMGPSVGGFWPVDERRLNRTSRSDSQRLEFIHKLGSPRDRSELSEFLKAKADAIAPHSIDEDGNLWDIKPGEQRPEHPRFNESPPEALP